MPSPRKSVKSPAPTPLDRHALYQLCAQSPTRDVKVLAAIHAHKPRTLGEDFCGTAALSSAWVELSSRHRAIAVDHDAATLARSTPHPRIKLIHADARRPRDPTDLIAVLNFSICELHDRATLIAYLRHARRRLTPSPRACFVCDIYGGSDAFFTGSIHQKFTGPSGQRIRYSWEQRTADPLTGRVINAMHFDVRHKGAAPFAFHDAFVYDWRLWSVPELRDALRDAGFTRTEVFERQPGAIDNDGDFHLSPIEDAGEIGSSFSLYVVGRT